MGLPLGLPKSAFINNKMYADSTFPPNPTEGDRIWRTDVQTWYTYGSSGWVADVSSAPVVSGTSFPASPYTAQRFYRTDHGIWYTYGTILGTPYWWPDAGSLVCSIYQGSNQNVPTNTATAIANMTGVDRNLNTWFNTGTSRFTPLVPGWYQFGGGIGWALTGTLGSYRLAYMRKNNTANIQGSLQELSPVVGANTYLGIRSVPAYLNGTGDYVELYGHSNGNNGSGFSPTISGSGSNTTNFWATYLNPIP